MLMLTTIRESWAWAGIDPAWAVAQNAFGNVIVCAVDGRFWRICPEELSCDVIAADETAFATLWTSKDFQRDWEMTNVLAAAQAKLGAVPDDRCYCLRIPAVLGGRYEAANFGTISRRELLTFAGDLARQIKDLPDGAQVSIKVTD